MHRAYVEVKARLCLEALPGTNVPADLKHAWISERSCALLVCPGHLAALSGRIISGTSHCSSPTTQAPRACCSGPARSPGAEGQTGQW